MQPSSSPRPTSGKQLVKRSPRLHPRPRSARAILGHIFWRRRHRCDRRILHRTSRPRGRRPRSCGAGLRCVWCCAAAAASLSRRRRPRDDDVTLSRPRRRHRGDRCKIKDAAPNRARTRRPSATAGPLGTATPPRRARLFLQSRRGPVNSLCRAGRAGRTCPCETSWRCSSYIKARRRPGRAVLMEGAAAVSEDCRAASV